jgi:hypothetical protein
MLPLAVGIEETHGLVTDFKHGTHVCGFPSGALFITQHQTSFGPDLALAPEAVPSGGFFPSPPRNISYLFPS